MKRHASLASLCFYFLATRLVFDNPHHPRRAFVALKIIVALLTNVLRMQLAQLSLSCPGIKRQKREPVCSLTTAAYGSNPFRVNRAAEQCRQFILVKAASLFTRASFIKHLHAFGRVSFNQAIIYGEIEYCSKKRNDDVNVLWRFPLGKKGVFECNDVLFAHILN